MIKCALQRRRKNYHNSENCEPNVENPTDYKHRQVSKTQYNVWRGNLCRKIGTYDVRRKYKTMLTMEDKRRVLWCFCEWPIVWSANLS